MNKAALLYVADAIEKHAIADLGFNMSDWVAKATSDYPDLSGHACGTTACIAGFAVALLDRHGEPRAKPLTNKQLLARLDTVGDLQELAAQTLGLSYDESGGLFGFQGSHSSMDHVTPAEAIAELRRLAADC